MPDRDSQASPAEYGYADGYAYLHICRTCFHLYEMGRPDGEEQRCACRPDGDPWPHYDFNQRAMLCRCCALTVLPSGSRWSPFFCRECQLLAMGVSVWNRRLTFPIGRHSLMHTWVPETPSASLRDHRAHPADLAQGVCRVINGVAAGSDGLQRWYETIMPRNLQHFGLEGDVSLRRYVEAVAAEAPALSTRLRTFEGLCRLFQFDLPPEPMAD